jgi:Recombination endonuclease VII
MALKVCVRGHESSSLPGGRNSSRQCRECAVIFQRRFRETERGKEQHRASVKRYRKKHPDRVRSLMRRVNGLPEPTRPCPEHCELCGGLPRGKPVLVLDHCHATGEFRGWLCSPCNLSLGHLGDTIEGLQRAAKYLARNDPSAWLIIDPGIGVAN